MDWGQANNFVWIWTVPAAAILFFISSFRRKTQMSRFGDLQLVQRLVASLSRPKRFAKRILLLMVLVLIVVALAQPHFRKKETLIERKGIDVMIAVDVSNSMLAKDIAPTRLEKAKLELSGLIDKLKGNRIGVVAFAGDAVIQCPLTMDRSAVKLLLSSVHPNLMTFQGTDIGKAVLASMQAFSDKNKDAKALILLTDGEDHNKETLSVIKKAKESGLRIFTIGIGTSDGATLPDEFGQGHKKDKSGRVILTKLNADLLQRIARETGGVYFRSAKGEVEADRIQKQIQLISTKGLSKDWGVEYEENYQFFLILVLVILTAEWILSESRRS